VQTVHAILRQDFGVLDPNVIRAELLSSDGVLGVSLEPSRTGLAIDYDPAILTPAKLVDLMCRCGVYPDPRKRPAEEQSGESGAAGAAEALSAG
jgi:hypothetical protein